MDLTQAQHKINELIEKINYYAHKYYDLDKPEISDYEYDILMNELKEIESEFPELVTENSPTQKVGGEVLNQFEKIEHKVQMGSLQDIFDISQLYSFEKKVLDANPKAEFVVETKIDGLSVSLEYENGIFVRGSTRGNGFIGEDITLNLQTIKSIPKKLIKPIEYLEVRGEAFMPKSVFEKLVNEQIENEQTPFKNPRNAAAGSLRQKNPKITAKRELEIFVFNIQQIVGYEIDNHKQSLDFLKELGFKVSPTYEVYNNIQGVIENINLIEENRNKYPFDIDGAVVKINDFITREKLGATTKFPKWAVAYKYPPEEKETALIDIQINVGRTGALTPTAVFEPIILAGTTVSRAVLHNQDFIDEKDIRIGDKIIVRKAGDIIPEVVRSVSHCENSVPYKIPNKCPVCGEKVVREDDQAVLKCENFNCPATVLRNIIHFASREAMNIEGLGPAVVKMLVDNDLIKGSADIYYIKAEQVTDLERMGEKSATNLINSIEKSKSNGLSKVIFGLGIRNVGQKVAQVLCKKYNTIDKLINAEFEEIKEIEGFGEVIAQSVVDYFSKQSNLDIIQKLKNAGVDLTEKSTQVNDKFLGLTFVLTGTLENYSRNDAKKIIEDFGGKVSGSVSSKTSYVLAGEQSGSKYEKALNLGINIISEKDFENMIK